MRFGQGPAISGNCFFELLPQSAPRGLSSASAQVTDLATLRGEGVMPFCLKLPLHRCTPPLLVLLMPVVGTGFSLFALVPQRTAERYPTDTLFGVFSVQAQQLVESAFLLLANERVCGHTKKE